MSTTASIVVVKTGRNRLVISLLTILILVNCVHGADQLQLDHVGLKLIRQSDVPAQEAGPLVEMLVTEGQHVKAGTLLARIDDQDAQIEVKRAELQRDNADQQARSNVALRSQQQLLQLAEMDWQRAENQQQRFPDTVSGAEMDRLRVALERAKLDVELARQQRSIAQRTLLAAENELRRAARGVTRRKVVAPIDGVVVAINYRLGEWVEVGDKLLRIVDTRRLRAEGFVSAEQLSSDLVGRKATFTLAGLNEGSNVSLGHVVFVSPEANPVSREVRLWAEVANPTGRLRPGLTGRLIIETQAPPPVSRPHTSQQVGAKR